MWNITKPFTAPKPHKNTWRPQILTRGLLQSLRAKHSNRAQKLHRQTPEEHGKTDTTFLLGCQLSIIKSKMLRITCPQTSLHSPLMKSIEIHMSSSVIYNCHFLAKTFWVCYPDRATTALGLAQQVGRQLCLSPNQRCHKKRAAALLYHFQIAKCLQRKNNSWTLLHFGDSKMRSSKNVNLM